MRQSAGSILGLSSDWRVYAAALLLVVVGVFAYSNALTNRFIGIDTIQAVRDNPGIRSLTPLSHALSLDRTGSAAANDNSTLVRRPVLSLSFALNYAALGPEARGFQAVNVAIHIVAGLLLFGVVRRTLTIRGYPGPRACWLAFSVAAIWLVHPLTTESVTNIVQRAESLMGCFALLTLYAAIRSWQAAAATGQHRVAVLWSAGAVCACALGMATKEIMIVVPVLVGLYDATFVCGSLFEPLRRRHFYLALASTWAVLVLSIALTLANSAREFEPGRMGSYILSQPHVIMHYLRLAFWPHPLFHYIIGGPFWFHPGIDSWFDWLRYAVPLGILLCGTLLAMLQRRPVGFLGATFFLLLLPTSLVATFTLIQEHRAYLALAAVVTAAVFAAETVLRRAAARWRLAGTATAVRVLLLSLTLAGLVYGTRVRNADYRSDLTLWAPDDLPLAFTMLGNLAMYHGQLSEAEQVFTTLVGAASDSRANEPLLPYRARALNGLGSVRALQGRWDDAQQLFGDALAQDPSYAPAENNLGVVLFGRGDRRAARPHLEHAVALDASRYRYVVVPSGDGTVANGGEAGAANELLPIASWFPNDQRRALMHTDLSRLQFSIVLNPPGEEFSMDYTLALVVKPSAQEQGHS